MKYKSVINSVLVGFVGISIASVSQAALLNLEPGSEVLNGVNIAKSASLQIEGQPVTLTGVGFGLRNYRILAAKVKVYVAQLMMSEPQKFSKRADEALGSLDNIRTVGMRITFLRNIEAQKIQVAFRDSLIANNVDLKAGEIEGFLQAITAGGEVSNGSSMTLVFNKNNDGGESVLFENASNGITEIRGARGFTQKIMSIWLGVTVDNEMAALKEQLLK